jgi:type I restriction enzyme M protein
VASFTERYPKQAKEHFDVILANPPFKGTIDHDSTDATLKSKVKTKKTELLFLVLMLRMLNQGGRCAVIVPDGVLFGSSGAHVAVRKMIVDDNQLEGVISLPSGVFKPYAGVSTAILVFAKGGRTDDVWFYDVLADGYSLDDKRSPQPDKNDVPDLVAKWKARDPKKQSERSKHFFVPIKEIRDNKYDLSINRYKEVAYEAAEYDKPKIILGNLRELEIDILKDIDELEGMLK